MSFRLGLKISSFVGRNLNPILDGAGGGEEGAKTVPPPSVFLCKFYKRWN